MGRKQRRLIIILLSALCLAAASALVMLAFRDNIVFFFGPSEIKAGKVQPGKRIRVGGLVVEGSVVKVGEKVSFGITDGVESVDIQYVGILPDLFREGQGIVAEGVLNQNLVFTASEVLAKHDENYMPPEVAEALKKSGHWKEGTEQ
ncbi:cytochrome c maturation protein CcmE [Alphaproteobacteria bacterium]|jgi:cytochrome c-type biogenesis protein CcmE|nr:cytochrome c maturation protein CcmE [Alphaproteobacteria bacterium]